MPEERTASSPAQATPPAEKVSLPQPLDALAAEPDRRYASPGDMGRALRGWLRRPFLAWAAAALAAVAVLAGLATTWRPRPAADPRPAVVAVGQEVVPTKALPEAPLTGTLRVQVWSPTAEGPKRG